MTQLTTFYRFTVF